MKRNDLFHTILNFLYRKPLDGSFYDLRECVNGKLNKADGERKAYGQFQQIIEFLVGKEYVVFKQWPSPKRQDSSEFHAVAVKYGEDPTGKHSEEANFETTYPMAALTLAGFNYVRDRKKESRSHVIYLATFALAFASIVISWLAFRANTNQKEMQEKMDEKQNAIEMKTVELEKANNIISIQQITLDSLKSIIFSKRLPGEKSQSDFVDQQH